MAKLAPSGAITAKVGRGEWKFHYDEDGNVICFELWDTDPKSKSISTYEAYKITKLA